MPPKLQQRRLSFLNRVASISKRRQHFAVSTSDETIASSVTTSSTNSNHSLISVIRRIRHASRNGQASKSKSARRVRFDESQNESISNTQICEEDVQELWYSDFDYTMFKSKVAIVCARIQRNERGPRNPLSYEYVVGSIFDTCCKCTSEKEIDILSEQQQVKLIHQLRGSPARLGIERMLVRKITDDKYERQRRMVEMVLLINSTETDVADMDEVFRKASMNASLPSRLFARYLGQANAASEDLV